MEELLTRLGEFVAKEVKGVKNVRYIDKEMGYICVICFEDGKNVMLALNELDAPS